MIDLAEPTQKAIALRWLLCAAVLLVTATPLVVTPGVLFPYVVGKATFARAVIEVTFGLWLAAAVLYKSSPRPELRPWARGGSWVLAAFFAWLAVSMICALAGVSPVRSLWSTYERMQGVVDLVHWFAFVLVAASVLRRDQDWQLLFTCSLTVGAIICVWGLLAYYGFIDQPGADGRLSATLGNPTYLGAYLSINALIGTGMLAQSYLRTAKPPEAAPTRRQLALRCLRAFWLIAVALSLWALWLTTSRGALAGLSVGAIVLLVALWPRDRSWRGATAVLVLVSICASGWLVIGNHDRSGDPEDMLSRIAAIGLDDPSSQRRLAGIGVGLDGFAERPAVGWGPENFVVVWGRHAQPGMGLGEHFDYAHNKLVEELATKGLVGLIAYVLLWASITLAICRAVSRGDDRQSALAAAVGAAFAALFVQNLFMPDSPATVMQFALLAAFAASCELRSASRPAAPLSKLSQRGLARTAAMLVVAALTASAVYAVAYRPFAAARIADDFVPRTADDAASAEDLAGIARAIDTFPPLGNLLRLRMFAAADMSSMSATDFSRALAMIETEGEAAVRAEPHNWRIPATLALAWQSAAIRDPSYRAKVSEQIDHFSAVAPGLSADVRKNRYGE